MNQQERDIIARFIERFAGMPQRNAWGAPQQPAEPLPPVDREADQFIAELFQRYPDARYRIVQTAFVQEAALVETNNRLRQLEWELQQARAMAQTAQQAYQQTAAQPPRSGGFLGGMFGGGGRQAPPPPLQMPRMPPPPQPQYPPNYNPATFQQPAAQGGSGFLGGALRTAAGVAGGVVVGSLLMDAFRGSGAASAATGAVDAASGAATGALDSAAAAAPAPWTNPQDAWSGGDAKGAAPADSAWGQDAAPDKSAWGEPAPSGSWDQGGQGKDWGGEPAAPAEEDWRNNSSSGDSGWGSDSGGDSGGDNNW